MQFWKYLSTSISVIRWHICALSEANIGAQIGTMKEAGYSEYVSPSKYMNIEQNYEARQSNIEFTLIPNTYGNSSSWSWGAAAVPIRNEGDWDDEFATLNEFIRAK